MPPSPRSEPAGSPAEPLRVALDTSCLYTTRAGTARYTQGLLSGFRLLGDDSPAIIPLAWPVENFGYRQPARALRTAYRELIWCRTRAYAEIKSAGCHLLHSNSHFAFRVPVGMARVHTLHDLAILRHPEKFRPWQRAASRRFLKKLASMHRIICVSQFTADEAMSLLSIPSRKITVVYNGADLAERTGPGGEQELAPLPTEFFLFVGSLEPGKNLALLKAVYQLAGQTGGPLPPLYIAGTRWEGVEGEGAPPKEWTYLGRVSDNALAALYRRATALVFPSKYEGFGLPVLEAMSFGCPVICSRSGSIPEVGGDAVCYSDLDAPGFLAAMRRLLTDPVRRDAMKAMGLERSRLFSWQRCAAETAAVYQSVLR
jgi:glycosyltransferase involved in cell wall biosynthesis